MLGRVEKRLLCVGVSFGEIREALALCRFFVWSNILTLTNVWCAVLKWGNNFGDACALFER